RSHLEEEEEAGAWDQRRACQGATILERWWWDTVKKGTQEACPGLSASHNDVIMNGDGTAAEEDDEPARTKSKKRKSKRREQRLDGGFIVLDVLVSLHYTKSLRSTGNVFDRNTSKQHPLVFCQRTGEVIRGLERGLEGMKVGGERLITIPRKLGYGSKGSGNEIPPDLNLVFEVKVSKVG
ncbi:hypothetical protein ACHAXA_001520, partial [Cyclostephanos tholiformis]